MSVITNGSVSTMWTRIRLPKLPYQPSLRKSTNAAIPIATFGTISGAATKPCAARRPGNRWRAIARPAAVPATSDNAVAARPSSRLRIVGSPKPPPWKRRPYHIVEKPGGGHCPNADELNDSTTTIAIGATMKTSPATRNR